MTNPGDPPPLPIDHSVWKQSRGCANKKRYSTRAAAKRAAKYHRPYEAFGPYLCEFCGAYHNGHRNRRGNL
jgi:hypothetical protein